MAKTRAGRPGGLVCPVITPVTPHNGLNGDALSRHIDALVPHVDGVFVLGSSGEHPWLPADVEREAVAVAGRQLDGRAALYVGAGQSSVDATLRTFDQYADSAADYLVVTPPTFFPLSDAETVDAFVTLADHAPRPVVLYNIPQFAGNGITAEVLREVAQHPRIVGVKDSSGDLSLVAAFLKARPSDFAVLQGRDHLIAATLRLGGDGAVAALSNIAAPLLAELVSAGQDTAGHHHLDALQDEVDHLGVLLAYGLVGALKASLELLGFPVGAPQRPARTVSAAERDQIAKILHTFDGRLLAAF